MLDFGSKLVDLSSPKIMGILNVTPDSFFDGGNFNSVDQALQQTEVMLEDGVTFIDVGGYSTRPGAIDISVEEELKRVTPIIKAIKKEFPNELVSIDSFRSEVVKAAVDTGADLINDVSGGTLDNAMFDVVAKANKYYVMMHMQGTPQTMSSLTDYNNLNETILSFFKTNIEALKNKGFEKVILDPGLGFAKTLEQNYELLNSVDVFKALNLPLLIGGSRKSMIWKLLNSTPEKALNGTTVINTVALMKGANILRVHDVKEANETIKIVNQLNSEPTF